MRYYLDASIIGSALLHESFSHIVRDFLQSHLTSIVVSQWTILETHSLIAQAHRRGMISIQTRETLFARFSEIIDAVAQVYDLSRDDFDSAVHCLRDQRLKLRSGDALHLGIALTFGNVVLVTNDRILLEAATLLGQPAQAIGLVS